MRAHVTASMLSLMVFGCFPVPKAPPHVDEAAKSFAVSPGSARIFIYSSDSGIPNYTYGVYIDARPAGVIQGGLYLLTEMAPAAHEVCAFSEYRGLAQLTVPPPPRCTALRLDLSQSGVYFVRVHLTSSTTMQLTMVAEAEGRPAVMKCRLSALRADHHLDWPNH